MTYRSAHHALICAFVDDHARHGHSGLNVGTTADKCGVSRDTVERLNGRIRQWLGPIEVDEPRPHRADSKSQPAASCALSGAFFGGEERSD